MQACVYNTNADWLKHLRTQRILDGVNFWRRDVRTLHLSPGAPFYFKLYRTHKSAGRGIFRAQTTLTMAEAWKRFGQGNGVGSLAEFENRAGEVLGISSPEADINCLILDDVSILKEEDYPSLQAGQFPPSIMGAKFFTLKELAAVEDAISKHSRELPPERIRAFTLAEELEANGEFEPASIVDSREKTLTAITLRRGQTRFRNLLLAAYRGRCAVTSTLLPDVLEAAHIVPYRGKATNRADNGLLLRADWHTLFDLGAWTLTDDFTIIVRPSLRSTDYGSFEGKELNLPDDPRLRPSLEAIRHHRAWATRQSGSLVRPFAS